MFRIGSITFVGLMVIAIYLGISRDLAAQVAVISQPGTILGSAEN